MQTTSGQRSSPGGRALDRSSALFERAKRVIAGGVSSDARRLQPVPLYVSHGRGARLWDVDGNELIDFVLGQGPLVLGHSPPAVVDAVAAQLARGLTYSAQHEREVEVAELVCELVPCADLVRFNSVGSEAVHAAWRVSRAYTGREKILKFEGHYHGWLDAALYSLHPDIHAAGPREHPVPVAGSRGQAASTAADLVIAPWNDLDTLVALMAEHGAEIAAVTMEPVLCNTGCIEPLPGFLEGAKRLCAEHGSLMIFDEVITGFRLAPGGAQEALGVTPDLAVFGKAVAGGLPLSCLAGRAEVMDLISRGEVGHAGTFNSNPVAIEAAHATLQALMADDAAAYAELRRIGLALMAGIRDAAAEAGVPALVTGPGSVFQVYFTSETSIDDYRDFAATDRAANVRFQRELRDRGVNTIPRGLWFVSTAHTDADVDATLTAVEETFASW